MGVEMPKIFRVEEGGLALKSLCHVLPLWMRWRCSWQIYTYIYIHKYTYISALVLGEGERCPWT